MKTTIEIADLLLTQAKAHARRTGRSLSALVEEGLRLVLAAERERSAYRLPHLAVGEAGGANPLEQLSWQDLRDEIYGGR